MDSQGQPVNARRWFIGFILSLGILAIICAAGYLVLGKGTFHRREKVAILTGNQASFWDPVQLGASDAAREYNVDLTFIKSEPNLQSQNQPLQDLLNNGVQGLAICPNNPEAQQSILNDAAGKIVLITIDSDAPNTSRKGFVGTNNYAAGQTAAEQVRAAIPDGGKILISVGSVGMINGRDRRQGVIDDLMDRPFKLHRTYDAPDATNLKGSKYEVVGTITDDGDPIKATQLLVDAIKAHPDINCIVGLFGYSGPAIVKAVEQAGKKDQIKIVGFDESPEEQADIASGAIYSSVLQEQYRCGYEAVRVMAELLRGVQVHGPTTTRLTELPVLVLQANNIEDMRKANIIRTPAS
jgi:ribose transport system substrate-binding protein